MVMWSIITCICTYVYSNGFSASYAFGFTTSPTVYTQASAVQSAAMYAPAVRAATSLVIPTVFVLVCDDYVY